MSASFVSLIGQKFHRLTPFAFSEKTDVNGKLYYQCRCDCDEHLPVDQRKTVETRGINLTKGYAKSCGCFNRDKNQDRMAISGWPYDKTNRPPLQKLRGRHQLDGQRFGLLVVVSESDERPMNPQSRHWFCRCDCGQTKVTTTVSLTHSQTKSCGCLRRRKLPTMPLPAASGPIVRCNVSFEHEFTG